MSRQIQIRRGSADENNAFTGAEGEITMDTTNKTLRVHDGTTAGGTVLAKQSEIPDLSNVDYVVESQMPSAENNYTWYRKYKSGWVEQGGIVTTANDTTVAIQLPVIMADTSYIIQKTGIGDSTSVSTPSFRTHCVSNKTASGFSTFANSLSLGGFMWVVYGVSQ